MKFYIIGIDNSSTPHFRPEVEQIINRGSVFSGGVRHHQIVADRLPEGAGWIDIVPPMNLLFERYEECEEIVVFASGDPLFFGFAQTIQRLMPTAQIELFPWFNSLQQLAHKTLLPYQNMKVVSLTGRPWHSFDEALIMGCDMIGLLTDKVNHTPSTIATRLIDYGYTNYDMVVGELLGGNDERIRRMKIEEVASCEFKFPNNIILIQTSPTKRRFGIPDSQFTLLDGREKMITKMAVRVATLTQLDLYGAKTFWDVGFCTGSISVEAKLQFPHLKISSFEIREGCDAIIEDNMRKFGAPGIDYHIGDFCSVDLEPFEGVDAAFIGGHGGKLDIIVAKIASKLRVGGALVFNSVSAESYAMFCDAVAKAGLTIDNETAITVDNFNKITIIKAIKI